MGQIRTPITTDLILRLINDIECPNCKEKINPYFGREEGRKEINQGTTLKCPECKKEFKAPYDIRQALAYKQLIENIYKCTISIDIAALGVEETPNIKGKGKNAHIDGITRKDKYGQDSGNERNTRVKAMLKSIANLSDFASQSRELTNACPDFVILSVQKQYNHRLASAIEMDEKGEVDENKFEKVIDDCIKIPAKLYAGAIPNIFKNQPEIEKILIDREIITEKILTPRETIENVISNIR